jgi:hypothetical protein
MRWTDSGWTDLGDQVDIRVARDAADAGIALTIDVAALPTDRL